MRPPSNFVKKPREFCLRTILEGGVFKKDIFSNRHLIITRQAMAGRLDGLKRSHLGGEARTSASPPPWNLAAGKAIDRTSRLGNHFCRLSSIREAISQTCPAWGEEDARERCFDVSPAITSVRSFPGGSKHLDQNLAVRGRVGSSRRKKLVYQRDVSDRAVRRIRSGRERVADLG